MWTWAYPEFCTFSIINQILLDFHRQRLNIYCLKNWNHFFYCWKKLTLYAKVINKRLSYNINCVCNLVLNSVKRRKFHRYNREQMCGRSRYTWAFRSVISGFPTTALSGLETSTFCVRRKEEEALTQINTSSLCNTDFWMS